MDYSISLFIIKIKRETKERKRKRLIVVSIRPGAPPAGSLPTPGQSTPKTLRADAPGRRHEISEYKILNDVSLFIFYYTVELLFL
jgi:hypothetical protein